LMKNAPLVWNKPLHTKAIRGIQCKLIIPWDKVNT
jgi:hypothetical protein